MDSIPTLAEYIARQAGVPGASCPNLPNTYIGMRYVPEFADPVEWDATMKTEYEYLKIVTYQGNSYTSRTWVPKNIPITNTDYWILTGNYNAQVEAYRKEVQALDGRITAVEGSLSGLEQETNNFDVLKVGHLGSEEGVLLGGKSFQSMDGLLLSTDGNTSWGYVQSSKYGSKTELTIQSRIYLGFCNVVNGIVTIISGTRFKQSLPIYKIWINETLYDIESYVSDTQINLVDKTVNLNNVRYQFLCNYAQGIVSTSGNTATYVSGDNFAYWWTGDNIYINNNKYTITSISNNGRTLTVSETLPSQAAVPFHHLGAYTDAATLGVNKCSGENEERIVLTAKASGEYRLGTVATGRGKHYPIYIDVSNKNAIKINTDGTVDFQFPIISHAQSGNASIGVRAGTTQGYLITNPQNKAVILYSDTEILSAYTGNHSISFNYVPQIPRFTKANLPANLPTGSIACCIDADPEIPVWYNGTSWVKFDNTPV